MEQPHSANQKGYIALLTTLIVGVVGVSIGVTLLLVGLGEGRTSFSAGESIEARAAANACAERALDRLRVGPSYAGGETFLIRSASCEVLPLSGAGTSRLIQVVGRRGEVVRKVKIEVNELRPRVQVSSWQEVADF